MTANTIAIIDYGMGNLHSISKALQHVAPEQNIIVTAQSQQILNADKVVLPGVGAIKDCMLEIKRHELQQTIIQASQSKPFLGICLGLQALLSHSDENQGIDGLNIIAGQVHQFQSQHLKIPHMGWNQVKTKAHPIWENIADNRYFYFVHSYYAQVDNLDYQIGETEYGQKFCAVLAKDNIVATQFHPEKSHEAGLQLLRNFANWNGE